MPRKTLMSTEQGFLFTYKAGRAKASAVPEMARQFERIRTGSEEYLNTVLTQFTSEVFFLATVTLSVPDELKEKMVRFPEMNWSAVARKAILERINLLEKMGKALSKSNLTEEDTILLGRKVRRAVSKRFGEAASRANRD